MRMKKYYLKTILLLAVVIITAACKNNIMYHSYQPVSPTGWEKNDTLSYTLNDTLTNINSHQFYVGIRHKDSYKYQDIWLTINNDTVHLQLADSSGYWYGNGIGELRQLLLPIPTTFLQKQDSITEIRINHIMQDNSLKGIQDLGIEIVRINARYDLHPYEERQTTK